MALVALASAKGSPGVTTAALVVGALWPRQVLLSECDPSGSDVAIRMTGPGQTALNPDRGLVSLAAAGRKGIGDEVIMAHSQQLDGGLEVLLGVRAPEQIGGMGGLWAPLGQAFDQMYGSDVLADCGRIGPNSPQLPVLQSARLVVLVCTATGSSVAHLRERVSSLVHHVDAQLGVIVVADPKRRDGVRQVWSVLDQMSTPIQHRWHLALDPAGAAFFDGRGVGRLDRTSLIRTGSVIAAEMAAAVAPRTSTDFDMAQAAFPTNNPSHYASGQHAAAPYDGSAPHGGTATYDSSTAPYDGTATYDAGTAATYDAAITDQETPSTASTSEAAGYTTSDYYGTGTTSTPDTTGTTGSADAAGEYQQ